MLLNRKTQSLPSVLRQQLQFLPARRVIVAPFPALTQPWGAWQFQSLFSDLLHWALNGQGLEKAAD